VNVIGSMKPVTEEEFNLWCERFRDLLVREWPGLVGLVIDGGVHELVRVVFTACQKRRDDSNIAINQEIERWTRLEFPDITLRFLKSGVLNPAQEEDLDLELGLC
jgi:hypothetical protein